MCLGVPAAMIGDAKNHQRVKRLVPPCATPRRTSRFRRCAGALAIAGLGFASTAGAVPITGDDIASDTIFNFDFTSATPAPPYGDTLRVEVTSSLGLGQAAMLDFFDHLGGARISTSQAIFGPSPYSIAIRFTGMQDGLFSIGVHTLGPAFDIAALTAVAIDFRGVQAVVEGQAVTRTLVEPDALALVAAAIGAITLTGKSKKR